MIRQRVPFNRDFAFRLGDVPEAESEALDDSAWQPVVLPHSFSMPYWREDEFYIGYGWYRKHFVVHTAWLDKKVHLEFEAAFQHAEVFVNGERVGEHRGGYTGFIIDLSDFLHAGDNVLAIRVNNLWQPDLAPRAGEHVFCGGIYRNMYLLITDPLHVDWCGTFVTTPEVSQESATVNVKTEIRNDDAKDRTCTVESAIVSPRGRLVHKMRSTAMVPAGGVQVVDQTTASLPKPHLWSVDSPQLYRVSTRVLVNDAVVDDYTTPFGIRWFEFTADRGFFLNGEHLYLQGANVHQDHAGWGDAVSDAGHARDVAMIKECGMNFIRGSHYPHSPAFARACDEQGMIFWSEGLYWGIGGFDAETPWRQSAYPPDPEHQAGFEESCRCSLKEMIKVNRNSPSVVAWSMGNEAFFTAPDVMEKARELVRSLARYSRELDPSRPAAMGGVQREGFDTATELAGYNGDGCKNYLDPGFPNLVAEYGSVVSDRPGCYDPCRGSLQEEQFPWRSGECLWCGFHHGSIAGDMGKMGMIDYFRLPLRAWYWYRNELCGIDPPEWPKRGVPVKLDLIGSSTVISDDSGHDDVHLTVTVLDGADKPLSSEIDITLQVVSGPGMFPTGRSIQFVPGSPIEMRDGKAAIEFRSFHAGETVIRATADGLQGAELTILSMGDHAYDPEDRRAGRLYAPRCHEAVASPCSMGETLRQREIGTQRPATASSEAPGHRACAANNRKQEDSWKADTNTTPQWWQLDMEGFYELKDIKLDVPADAMYDILISADGATWTQLAQQSKSARSRFLRVEFRQSPEIRNIEIYGRECACIHTEITN
jgi:beta-galactosidase